MLDTFIDSMKEIAVQQQNSS